MSDSNVHYETVDGKEIEHKVAVKNFDIFVWHSWEVKSERRRKIGHALGPLHWDTWELDGNALAFAVTDSLDDGTISGPYLPEVEVAEGTRTFATSDLGTGTVVGRKAGYQFQGKEYTVEVGTNWVSRAAAAVVALVLVVVIVVVLVVAFG